MGAQSLTDESPIGNSLPAEILDQRSARFFAYSLVEHFHNHPLVVIRPPGNAKRCFFQGFNIQSSDTL